jgi:hypothetical protein
MKSAVVEAALKKSGMAPTLAVNAAKGVQLKVQLQKVLPRVRKSQLTLLPKTLYPKTPTYSQKKTLARVLESTVAGAAVGVPLGFTGGGTGRGFTQRAVSLPKKGVEEEQAAAQID